jgi:hypothetical protein
VDDLITQKKVMLHGSPRILYKHQYNKWIARVIIPEKENDCWGSVTGWKLQVYIGGQASYASIFSFLWHHGDLLVGNEVCHTCDNNVCGNPLHLWQGTHQQNMIDCSKKGRTRGGHNKHGDRWGDVMRKAWETRRGA